MSNEEGIIEEAFQDALAELRKLHLDKLALIKKYRDAKNLQQLTKIRESLKNGQN